MEEVRWRECVSYVNSNMESAVGSLYIKRAFSKDSKSTVRISGLPWVSHLAGIPVPIISTPPGDSYARPVQPLFSP